MAVGDYRRLAGAEVFAFAALTRFGQQADRRADHGRYGSAARDRDLIPARPRAPSCAHREEAHPDHQHPDRRRVREFVRARDQRRDDTRRARPPRPSSHAEQQVIHAEPQSAAGPMKRGSIETRRKCQIQARSASTLRTILTSEPRSGSPPVRAPLRPICPGWSVRDSAADAAGCFRSADRRSSA